VLILILDLNSRFLLSYAEENWPEEDASDMDEAEADGESAGSGGEHDGARPRTGTMQMGEN
jgi:hypothetical protein